MVYLRLDRRFFFIPNQVPHGLALFIHPAQVHGVEAEGDKASPIFACQHHLLLARPHADRGLFGFAGRLPEPNVIEQLVNVVVEPLLSFLHASNPDAVGGEPLNHERRFIIAAAQAVEHEYQQHIEFPGQRRLFYLHDGVALFGGYTMT